jgi:hypothetical protein
MALMERDLMEAMLEIFLLVQHCLGMGYVDYVRQEGTFEKSCSYDSRWRARQEDGSALSLEAEASASFRRKVARHRLQP